ncbi:hypothetical protein ACF3NR_03805 [Vaginella massiliensis]|uniref:hypothetical protein n=1 Tax=Vaginella massiliensis TaxID=1816680 RepID=UPI0008389104|nr:hypothetical protein [Vaginella massiliensis]
MKKAILGLSVLGLVAFTSCKSEAEKKVDNVKDTQEVISETTNDATETARDEAVNVMETLEKMPAFSSPEAKTFADKYAAYVHELKTVAASGDQAKLAELQGKAVEYTKEMATLAQKLTPEDAKKLSDWAAELQKSLNK